MMYFEAESIIRIHTTLIIKNYQNIKGKLGMCMAEVAQSEMGEPHPEPGCRCSACGALVDKLYQREMCKSCLVQSFQQVVRVIDYYRGGGANPSPQL
jgi:hypothetical protein